MRTNNFRQISNQPLDWASFMAAKAICFNNPQKWVDNTTNNDIKKKQPFAPFLSFQEFDCCCYLYAFHGYCQKKISYAVFKIWYPLVDFRLIPSKSALYCCRSLFQKHFKDAGRSFRYIPVYHFKVLIQQLEQQQLQSKECEFYLF